MYAGVLCEKAAVRTKAVAAAVHFVIALQQTCSAPLFGPVQHLCQAPWPAVDTCKQTLQLSHA